MATCYLKPGTVFIILACAGILASGIPVISSASADGAWPDTLLAGKDLNVTNYSLANGTIPDRYQATREPIRLQLELNQTTLPGPRYMAFGPSYIGVWIDPVVLAALLVVAATGVCAWYFVRRRRLEEAERQSREPENREEDQKES